METVVTKLLNEKGIKFIVKPHANDVFTCEDAARERGVRLAQVLKCMVGQAPDGQIFAMLIPGDRMLKLKKARKEAGGIGINLVPPQELAKRFTLTVGAISPTQLLGKAHFMIDNKVFDEEFIDISSGEPNAGVELRVEDLSQLLSAQRCDIISTSS